MPGTWAEPPAVGLLWTPGYWGWGDGVYLWHGGYWGPHVGFYGGINYGFGYGGVGYEGGYWDHGAFRYNAAVNRIDTNIIHNTYNHAVVRDNVSRVAFNGGRGGLAARPQPEELAAARERHVAATEAQRGHAETARGDRNQFANVNHGHPGITATGRPGDFAGRGGEAGPARPDGTGPARPDGAGPARPDGAGSAGARPAEPHGGVATPHPIARQGQPASPGAARPGGQAFGGQSQGAQRPATHIRPLRMQPPRTRSPSTNLPSARPPSVRRVKPSSVPPRRPGRRRRGRHSTRRPSSMARKSITGTIEP